jgi:hypothetical protein
MQGGTLRGVEDRCEFLSALPREQWPVHEADADAPIEYENRPVCGRTDLTATERAELMGRLSDFAQGLYRGPLFRSLYSLTETNLLGLRPTFTLTLLVDAARNATVFEYDPASCGFVPVEDGRLQTPVLAGLECWATDLLDVLRTRMAPIGMAFGHTRTWNAAPQHFTFQPLHELWQLHHPLRRPAEYTALYRELAASAVQHQPVVRANL